jgi:ankyrin repeat protein
MSLSDISDRLFKPSLDEKKFFAALEDRDEKYIAKILKHYPAVANRLDPKGRSPLNIAVDGHMTAICRLLLEANANLEHIDPVMQMQPLNRALHTAYVDIAELLIDKGADVNARDGNGNRSGSNNGQTPLYMAVSECPVSLLRKLVAKGAQVNVYCDDCTPLILAAMADNWEDKQAVVRYLISAGADIGMGKPSNKVTADQIAQRDETKRYLSNLKKAYDLVKAAEEKAQQGVNDMMDRLAAERRDKAYMSEEIAKITEGTRETLAVKPPLRFRLR